MSKQQPTLFSFFKTVQSGNTVNNENSNSKASPIQKNGMESKGFKSLDLVWAKLDGYPWWPALVYEHPVEKLIYRAKCVHVQFFDEPPQRGWVRKTFVKPYGSPESCGINSYKDPLWIQAKEEADQVISMPIEERESLIVPMMPSDNEDTENESMDVSDVSKENIDINILRGGKRTSGGDGEPKPKRRKILLLSDSDQSEDEYKPVESESDDTVSSGVDENQITDNEPETESEAGTPIKESPIRKKNAKSKAPRRNISFTPKSFSNHSVNTPSPRVLNSTKTKLSAFSAASGTPSKSPNEEGDWPFTKLSWLRSDNIKDKNQRPSSNPDYDPRTLYVPEEFLPKQTPAMRQWWELKSNNFDTVLFFKMGKFYELFHMDAILSIQELGLLMMKGEQAHTGFPEISFGRYASVLVERGFKVARVEQVETPDMMEKRCKTISRPTKFDKVVKRELCQVMSLGTRVPSIMDGDSSDDNPHYLLSITENELDGPGGKRIFGVAFIDVSIGAFHLGQFEDDRHLSRLRTLLAQYPPSQVLTEKSKFNPDTIQMLKSLVPAGLIDALVTGKEFWDASKTLSFLAESEYFKSESGSLDWPQNIKDVLDEADTLGLTCKEEYELSVRSLGGLIWYLKRCHIEQDLLTRKMFEIYQPPDVNKTDLFMEDSPMASRAFGKYMILDGNTLRNLEVFENSLDGSTDGTLFQTLNHCATPFGKRLLRQWLCNPLCSKSAIDSRLDAIEDLRGNPEVVSVIQPLLKSLPDLEKLLSKIHSLGLKRSSDHPDSRAIFYETNQYSKRKVQDFLAALEGFKVAVSIVNSFKDIRNDLKSDLLKKCVTYLDDGGKFAPLDEIHNYFNNAFDHALAKKEGKIVPSKGVDAEFDEATFKIEETNKILDDYLKEQCKHFSAKVTFWGNDKKRFQLEVPDHAAKRAGDDYELVSQRKGYKRFWTEETRTCLAEVVVAEERRNAALQDIARRIFSHFDQSHDKWRSAVECLSVIDVLLSLTEFSLQVESTRPQIAVPLDNEKPYMKIREGRHPCSIQIFNGGDFIPNDIVIGVSDDADSHSSLVLVTGPNMGGKSTLMRQTALICILAQVGSFVPAQECSLSTVDWIFTRLGASDRIYDGESTFFVELAETASIIRHATRNSLVIVDELGRGTATYDGTAIAHSVVEELVKIGSRTLFSTHYHSLVDDFGKSKDISLGHMSCIVENETEDPSQETVTFLYKFVRGACPKSYGFNAARLAELPESVIRSASRKAKEFERAKKERNLVRLILSGSQVDCKQLKEKVGGLRDIIGVA